MLRMFQTSFVLPYYNHWNIGIQTSLMRDTKTTVWGHHAAYVLHAYSLLIMNARSSVQAFEQTMNKILSDYFYSHSRIYDFGESLY